MNGPPYAAELLADGGAAASQPEFFRSDEFLEAEGVTHTLSVGSDDEDRPLLAPLIVRSDLDGERRDGISPYGFPGFATPAPFLADPERIDFSATGLVSLFIRHAVALEPPLAGATPRNVVLLADPELPRKSRMSDRQQVRRNERSGYRVDIVEGPASTDAQREGFFVAYSETMERARADDRYLYGRDYFDRLLSFSGSWLALAMRDVAVSAASICVRSDGLLHYHLSGTTETGLRDSPMKNVVSALVELAAQQGLPLNLGGGIRAGDQLEEFKRGFANRSERLATSEVVCDREAYERLSSGRSATGFFPAYRAP